YLPGWKRDFGFRVATGLYYQMPFYKELRDTLTDADGVTSVRLNPAIRAQRSWQLVLGSDYYFRAFGRPFKFTAEAYLKLADNVISYTVDNVRIRYSGKNDAKARTMGVDFKLYGELVPGADSWISFSLMRSREDVQNDGRGWIARPNEQRYSFSMLFQDYLPNNPR
ncbi:MAG: TonB-dependent receptor, partial [Paludibacteraceae bacterium]|nr:TonB-dependent receptor [Paludibacteraceae bacterium]